MVTLNDLLWTAIRNAQHATYPEGLTKEELEKAKDQKSVEEYNRLRKKFGL